MLGDMRNGADFINQASFIAFSFKLWRVSIYGKDNSWQGRKRERRKMEAPQSLHMGTSSCDNCIIVPKFYLQISPLHLSPTMYEFYTRCSAPTNQYILNCSFFPPHIYNPYLLLRLPPRQPKTRRHIEENINVVIHPAKQLLARPLREHRHVRERVHALRVAHRQRAVDDEPRDGVLVVDDVVVLFRRRVDRRDARARLVHLVVLAVVRVGAHGGEEGVAASREEG